MIGSHERSFRAEANGVDSKRHSRLGFLQPALRPRFSGQATILLKTKHKSPKLKDSDSRPEHPATPTLSRECPLQLDVVRAPEERG